MKMDVKDYFYNKLYQNELQSLKNSESGYLLDVQPYKETPKLVIPKDNFKCFFPLSDQLKTNLALIYSQIGELSIGWEISNNSDNLILENNWIKKNYLDQDYSISIIKEYLSGTINIVPFREMIDTKKYSYLKKGSVRYLPFDLHYELMVCFKMSNGIVEDNLYIFNVQDSDAIEDMKIGCIDYLKLAYEAKCFYQWQYAYVAKKSIDNKRLKIMLPEILPHVGLNLAKF